MALKPAPLNTSFMIVGILGFIISLVYIYPKLDPSWGFAFAVVFFAMIISALISMARAPPQGQLMPKLERAIVSGREMSIPKPPMELLAVSRKKPKKKAAKKKVKRKSSKKKKRK
jgi:hypothetical protein